jgi:hypothetical protein
VLNSELEQHSLLEYQLRIAGLLRYYWFRMSDSLVPVGLALAVVAGLAKMQASRPLLATWLSIAASLLAGANLADVCYWRSQQWVPPAILQPRPTADSESKWWTTRSNPPQAGELTAAQWYRDWQSVCAWAAANTPADAVFITPREQQTFKWYAARPEVVNWKDVPQDARGILEWQRRMQAIYPRDRAHHRQDLAAFSDRELVALAHQFGARYILLDRTRAGRRVGLFRLYPSLSDDNPSFEVYRVPEPGQP